MPNKNQQFRLKVLDQCLQNRGRQYTISNLLDEVNKKLQEHNPEKSVSKRTIYSDIDCIEKYYNIPIQKKKEGRYTFYSYEDKSNSIYNMTISPEDRNLLRSALKTILSINGLPQQQWVKEIENILSENNHLDMNSKAIGMEQNVDLVGLDHIRPLYDAIMNERVMEVDYCDFKDEDYTFIIHPYYLKQYNKRWYVICYNETKDKEYWLLALDRIQDLSPHDESHYNKNYNRDWDDFFYNIIGVTLHQEEEPIEVKLKVHKDRAPYIKTKPLHPSQKVKDKEDYIIVRIKVIPNKELISLILSYGDDMKVLEPQSVKNEVKRRLNNLINVYDL